MSEVKIYTLVMGEKEILGFKHGDEQRIGEFVKYKDYAELKAKCAAMAGEVAYLRGEIENHSQSTHFCGKCGEADPCITDDVCWSLKHPIPATDAFLAEVRAQGVEMFAASMKVVGGHEHPYSAVANEFAAQLRKGVQS